MAAVASFDELIIEIWPDGVTGDPVDISQRIRNVVITTSAPGGDQALTFDYVDASDRDTTTYDTTLGAIIRDGTRITVRDAPVDEDGVFWVGRVEVDDIDAWRGGGLISVVCRGYSSSARDQIYHEKTQWFQGTNVISIFADTLAALCPDIADPGLDGDTELFGLGRVIQEQATRDFVLSNAESIWTYLASIGAAGGADTPLLWRVMNLTRDGVYTGLEPVLQVRPRPAIGEVSYYTQMAPGSGHRGGTRLKVGGDLQQFINRVYVKMDNIDKSLPYTVFVAPPGGTPLSATASGVRAYRDLGIELQGVGDGIDGYSVANTILAQVQQAFATSGTVRMVYPQTSLPAPTSGDPIALWRQRAGETIKVQDWRPRDGFFSSPQPSAADEFYIVGTSCDRRGWTGTVGMRNGFTESLGRALKAKEPGRGDVTNSAPYTIIGRIINVGAWSDMLPDIGSTNQGAMAASVLHHHGTPNGDITTEALFNNHDGTDDPPPIPVGGLVVPVGLIRGSWHKFRISITAGGGPVTFHVSFPPAHWASADGSKSGALPGDAFDVSGGDGVEVNHVVECQTATVAKVTLTNNSGGAVIAALHFFGSRNLTISDPSPSAVKHGPDL